MEFTCVYELSHHGIKGQHWGVKNGPPYPLDPSDKSKAEKKAEQKERHSGFNKKKAIKIGGALVGTALLTAGAIYMAKSGKLDNLIKLGHNNTKIALNNMPINFGGSDENDRLNEISKSSGLYKALDNRNPTHATDNCKDLSICNACYVNGIDVTAGKNSFFGNLSQMFQNKFKREMDGPNPIVRSYNPSSANLTDGEQIKQDLSKKILRRGKEGDVGVVGITYSDSRIERMIKAKMLRDNLTYEEAAKKVDRGHAFNYIIENGQVTFACGQKGYPEDMSSIFGKINTKVDIEYAKITKELAEELAKFY